MSTDYASSAFLVSHFQNGQMSKEDKIKLDGIPEGGGGGSLQDAYDGGNTIACDAGLPVDIAADPTTDYAVRLRDQDEVERGGVHANSTGVSLRSAAGKRTALIAGNITGAAEGGAVLMQAGVNTDEEGPGGPAAVYAGWGETGGELAMGAGDGMVGAGGSVNTYAGNGGTDAGNGGDYNINAGAAGEGGQAGDIKIGETNGRDVDLQAGRELKIGYRGQPNKAIRVAVNLTSIRGADSTADAFTASANGIGGTPRMSFFGAAVVDPQTVAALINNVASGGTNDQVDNWTDLTTYATDAAAIRNAVYQLARKVAQLQAALDAYNLV